ncbi:unannotated protein [freshwater metagenome]|uniref:Unannotated protein n=1 Tax=freshwater metagenome TaxID=449393 RepID=A0A6J6L435_9ZZZZ
MQVIDVAETTTTLAHGAPPTLTVAPAAKLVPVIVIEVPPAVFPEDGKMPATVGVDIGVTYVYVPVEVVNPVSEFVTITSLAPADPAGVVQVIDVAETTTTLAHGAPPTLTVAPAAKLVPVIVIEVPPAVFPEDGEIEVMVGSEGAKVNISTPDSDPFVTTTAQTPIEVAVMVVGFVESSRVQLAAELSAELIEYVSEPPEPPVVETEIVAINGEPVLELGESTNVNGW